MKKVIENNIAKIEGFTLLEVLICLAIIGISFGVVFTEMSLSKRMAIKADRKMTISRIVTNIMANTQLIRNIDSNEVKEGEVKGEEGWYYSVSVKPLVLTDIDGENDLEVSGMFELELCLYFENDVRREGPYCFRRWLRK